MSTKGYVGSPDLQTSTENQDIIKELESDWTNGYSFTRFEFYNYDTCHVSINGGDFIYLEAYQNFKSDTNSRKINSFVIQEPDIQFHWIGHYK